MGRAPCCEKVGLKRGPWSPQEDKILINFIQLNGHSNWRALPKKAGLLRCGKSCRLRWTNYLRPDIKRGDFTLEEEETIINLHQRLGNRWATIAAKLPGRTDNEIKNVWHTHLKKRLNQNQTLKDDTQPKKKTGFRKRPPCSVIKSDSGDQVNRCTMNNNNDTDDIRLVELAFAEDFFKNLLSEEEFFENDWNLEKDDNCEMIIKGDQSPQDQVDQIPFSGEEISSCSSSDTLDIMDFWRSVFMRDGELPEILQESNII